MNFFTLMTALGEAAYTQALATETPLVFTHLAIGDGNGAPINPAREMESLVREVHRIVVSSINQDATHPNWLIIEGIVPANVGGWTIREIGLIEASGDMVHVGNFPESYKPVVAEGSGRDMVLRFIIETSSNALVTLTVDPSVAQASVKTVEDAIAAHEAKADPHQQYIKTSQKGVANGVAPLGVDNMVPQEFLPPAIATDAELAASLYAHVDPLADPHQQYLKESDAKTLYGAFIAYFSGEKAIGVDNHRDHCVSTAAGAIVVAKMDTLWNGFQFSVDAQVGDISITPNPADKINNGAVGANYLVPTGTSAQFVSDGAGNLAVFYQTAVPGSSPAPQYINESRPITSGQYIVDSSASTLILTLPAAPVMGTSIRLIDALNTWWINPVTLTPGGGNTISGNDGNFILDVPGADIFLIFKAGNWSIQ